MSIVLKCGDALTLLREMPDASVDAIVTDPPYGTTCDAAIASSRSVRVPPETQFYEVWLREHLNEWLRVLHASGALWLTLDWRSCLILDRLASKCGIRRPPAIGIWDKERIGMGGILRRSYEPFAVLMMNEFRLRTHSERDVWRVSWGGGCPTQHPAEKPLPLIRRALELISDPTQTVVDPFMGSGTTGVACAQSMRNFIGFDINPDYVEMARKRIANDAPLFAEGA